MSEARRTLRCWLLTAFLERGGCDPWTPRLPAAPARVRPLSAAELAALAGRRRTVEFLPRRAAVTAAMAPAGLAVVLPFRPAG